jgi:hypothetical protein
MERFVVSHKATLVASRLACLALIAAMVLLGLMVGRAQGATNAFYNCQVRVTVKGAYVVYRLHGYGVSQRDCVRLRNALTAKQPTLHPVIVRNHSGMRLYAAFAHLSGGVVYDGYLKIYSKNAYIGGLTAEWFTKQFEGDGWE